MSVNAEVQHARHMTSSQMYLTSMWIIIFMNPVPSRWRGTWSDIYADNHTLAMRATPEPHLSKFVSASLAWVISAPCIRAFRMSHSPIVANFIKWIYYMTRSHQFWADRPWLESDNWGSDLPKQSSFCWGRLKLWRAFSQFKTNAVMV